MLDLKKLAELATFEVTAEPELEGPEGHFASGDDELDRQDCESIRAELEWNEWAWCVAKVTASYAGLRGEAYLGGCSYADAEDFAQPGGHFDDMKDEALGYLLEELERTEKALAELAGEL